MKAILVPSLLFSLQVYCCATSISVARDDGAYSLFLNGDPSNGAFDTVDISLKSLGGAAFLNPDTNGLSGFIPLVPGQSHTFINAFLAYDEGEGWTILGRRTESSIVAFAGTPIQRKIDTSSHPGGNLFLANVYLPTGRGIATVDVINEGVLVASLSSTFGVPEPASSVLSVIAALTAATTARRVR